AAIDANCLNGRVDSVGPETTDAQEMLPQQPSNALPVQVGPDKQVVQVRPVTSGDVAAKVRATFRDPMRITGCCEPICYGSLTEALKELHGFRIRPVRHYQWCYSLQQIADYLGVCRICFADPECHVPVIHGTSTHLQVRNARAPNELPPIGTRLDRRSTLCMPPKILREQV